MNYTGPVYRPPIEAQTPLLQVTVGCAHNKCTFCTMYRSVSFSVQPLDQVERDIQEMQRIYGRNLDRIFLVNGDAFVLSGKRLKEIANSIMEYFPKIKTIAMYASINNILTKTDEELMELREHRINDLYIGLETGTNDVLEKINKGYNLEEAKEQLHRLNKANINHNALLMLGVAGQGRGIENARNTARLLNETKPQLTILCTLGLFEGGELSSQMAQGIFTPATELEVLEEEKELINSIELADFPLYGMHPSNTTPVVGIIPRDREKMIAVLNKAIENGDAKILNTSIKRYSL